MRIRKGLCVCVAVLFAAVLMTVHPRQARAGDAAWTMAEYAMGGAALGSLLGAAGATIPYLNDKQSFDFLVGGGAGALAGAGGGLILGTIDIIRQQMGKGRRYSAVPLKLNLGVSPNLVFLSYKERF